MYLYNLSQQILRDMWAHKFRSILASFGIIWGTLTVVLLLAFGQGFYTASKRDIMQIVDGTFFVVPTVTSISYKGFPKGQLVNLKAKTIMDIPQQVPLIKYVSPIMVTEAFISHQDNQTKTKIIGVSSDFAKMRKLRLTSQSRFINLIDAQQKHRVAIIGNKLKNTLFKKQPVLGQLILINNTPFKIIGAIEKSSKSVHKNNVIIPYTTYISLWGNLKINYFVLHPKNTDNLEQAELSTRGYIAHRLHFDKTDKVALKVFNTTKMFRFFTWFFFGIQLFLGLCGAITLGVGSLGVANIMFLIVTERTKEIGLLMAIGAKDWQILLQILLEALILVGIGGLIGFLLAYFITIIFNYITLPNWLGIPEISMTTVIITISVLAILGMLAGFFPARRASKMDPVEALAFK